MAQISQPTADFVTSTLNGALTAGATSATIGTGLNLPATNGVLQIDYDSVIAVGVDEGPETIFYTSYTSGTGALAGLTRGVADTTGVAHDNGSKVQQGVSAYWFGNGLIKQADLNTDSGDLGGAWASWTPSWTAVTVGNGTVTAKYGQIGKTVFARIKFVLGSSSAMNADTTFTLPVTSTSALYTAAVSTIGGARMEDTGTNTYEGPVRWRSTTTADIVVWNASSTYVQVSALSTTIPFTWGNLDEVNLGFLYEAA